MRETFGDPIDQHALALQMLNDLKPYIENSEHLQKAIEFGTHLWEFAVFLNVKKDASRLACFNELCTCFLTAKKQHPNDFIASYRHYYKAKNKAIKDYADLFHLERSKSQTPHDLSVKIAFQEIGQLIEGCIQPFARHFLYLINLAQTNMSIRSLADFDRMSLGDVVTALNGKSAFHNLYAPAPWNLSISQWRNIASHCSYSYRKDTQTILCTYGKTGKTKSVELTYADILKLCKAVNDIGCFHKMTDAIFSLGIFDIISPLVSAHDITPDTIVGTIIEFLSSNSLTVVSLNYETSPWELNAIDRLNRSEQQLTHILYHIARFIKIIENNAMVCTIEEKDTGFIRKTLIK